MQLTKLFTKNMQTRSVKNEKVEGTNYNNNNKVIFFELMESHLNAFICVHLFTEGVRGGSEDLFRRAIGECDYKNLTLVHARQNLLRKRSVALALKCKKLATFNNANPLFATAELQRSPQVIKHTSRLCKRNR